MRVDGDDEEVDAGGGRPKFFFGAAGGPPEKVSCCCRRPPHRDHPGSSSFVPAHPPAPGKTAQPHQLPPALYPPTVLLVPPPVLGRAIMLAFGVSIVTYISL